MHDLQVQLADKEAKIVELSTRITEQANDHLAELHEREQSYNSVVRQNTVLARENNSLTLQVNDQKSKNAILTKRVVELENTIERQLLTTKELDRELSLANELLKEKSTLELDLAELRARYEDLSNHYMSTKTILKQNSNTFRDSYSKLKSTYDDLMMQVKALRQKAKKETSYLLRHELESQAQAAETICKAMQPSEKLMLSKFDDNQFVLDDIATIQSSSSSETIDDGNDILSNTVASGDDIDGGTTVDSFSIAEDNTAIDDDNKGIPLVQSHDQSLDDDDDDGPSDLASPDQSHITYNSTDAEEEDDEDDEEEEEHFKMIPTEKQFWTMIDSMSMRLSRTTDRN
jgi:hypothetical protein